MTNYKQERGDPAIVYEPEDEGTKRYVKLEPGVYQVFDRGGMGSFRPSFYKWIEQDKLIRFKSGIVNDIINKASDFLSDKTRDVYKELKIIHKVGIIFHGKQGTGKTSVCYLIMREMAEKYGAICLDFTGRTMNFILYTAHKVRETQDNPIVVFMDEFEHVVKMEEQKLLTFLDGGNSVEKCMVIACTNYLDKIPDRIKFRKSRIKYMYPINALPEEIYREYILDRVPGIGETALKELLYRSTDEGLTIDELKHTLIDYRLENLTIEKAIEGVLQYERGAKKKKTEPQEDEGDDVP
jgi:hypothetical protein